MCILWVLYYYLIELESLQDPAVAAAACGLSVRPQLKQRSFIYMNFVFTSFYPIRNCSQITRFLVMLSANIDQLVNELFKMHQTAVKA